MNLEQLFYILGISFFLIALLIIGVFVVTMWLAWQKFQKMKDSATSVSSLLNMSKHVYGQSRFKSGRFFALVPLVLALLQWIKKNKKS